MKRSLIGLVLVLHGMGHAAIVPPSIDDGDSWLLERLGLGADAIQAVGTLLWATAMVAFLLAGFGVAGTVVVRAHWRWMAAIAAMASSAAFILYWQPQMAFGLALDVAVLVWLLVERFRERLGPRFGVGSLSF